MSSLNPSTFAFLVPLLLPALISLVAGTLRQDTFPQPVNEGISWIIVFLAALTSFFFGVGGRLTGNTLIDFMALVAYCGVLVHSAPLKPLQEFLQRNVLSLGASKTGQQQQSPVATIEEVKASLDALLVFLSSKPTPQEQAPTPVQQVYGSPPAVPSQGELAALVAQQPTSQLDFPNTYPLAAIQVPQPPKG